MNKGMFMVTKADVIISPSSEKKICETKDTGKYVCAGGDGESHEIFAKGPMEVNTFTEFT